MKRYVLIVSAFLICALLQAEAEFEPPIRIQSVLTDPLGSDTGGEYVRLLNTGQIERDISLWDLDADQLPYFTFPPGTILPPGGTLTVHLRQNGVPTVQDLYTGASFGTTNMGNTKGMVALFRSHTHDAGALEDFVQWGAGAQTHSQIAGQTGMFDPELYVPVGAEGEEIVFVPSSVGYEGESGTGEVLEEDEESSNLEMQEEVVEEEQSEDLPDIRLAYVAMNNPSGIADYIGISIEDAKATSSTGRLLQGVFLQVDTQKFFLNDIYVHSGDMLHISLGSGEQTLRVPGISRLPTYHLRWEQLSGLVATTEQVALWSDTGIQFDGVCWEKGVTPQVELLDMESFKSTFWQGSCIQSDLVSQGTVLEQELEILLETEFGRRSQESFWNFVSPQSAANSSPLDTVQVQTSTRTSTQTTSQHETSEPPCALSLTSVMINEFMPNPEGEDTGREWIELKNTTNEEIILCGILLDDVDGASKAFDITGYRIPAQGYLLISDAVSKISLGNTSDTVRLLKKDLSVLFELPYSAAPSGKSYSMVE